MVMLPAKIHYGKEIQSKAGKGKDAPGGGRTTRDVLVPPVMNSSSGSLFCRENLLELKS